METFKKLITGILLIPMLFISCTNESFLDEESFKEITPGINRAAITEPIVLGYFPSWSESWATTGQGSKLRDIPEHVTHVFLAFAKPNLRYQKGSLDITGTGIQTPYGGQTLKESVSILKTKGIKVILSIGGETYWGSNAAYDINYQHIKDLVDDIGFEGIDWDFEPNGGFQTIGESINVQRFITFFNESRALMPKGQYIIACAPAGAGALGGLNNDDPSSPFAHSKRNSVTGESDANLFNATSPNQAISLFGFASTGHMIPVIKTVGNKIDLIAYQGYNTGAATNRAIMYDSYKHYANQYGFSIAAGTHYPDEPWGPYFTYNYQNMANLSSHISSKSTTDGIMIWQMLLEGASSSAYGYLYVSSQVLNGISESQAIANAENYPESPYNGDGNGGDGGGNGSGCSANQWNSAVAYTNGNEVVYQATLYRAKWWTQGDIPSSNNGNGKPWELIENCDGDTDGDGGDTDGDNCSQSQWNSSTAYSGGNEVTYQNSIYKAKWWTQGDIPATNTGSGRPWEFVRNCN
ncbi:carbohydrate-binding protein [uncultured Aquimarina sp.]|uniref:carbohydrate-binding protein n=1 Tax=uncultured Aquimarina sp. TaxID=575652 RepID=UPI0026219FB7|nr:carbohydrate-binding protein [uncultured Aquimarina sp.]